MARHQRLETPDENTEIELSPMIDCIFILLIFFIVTTVFVEEPGIQVKKPYAAETERLEKNSILIALTESNKIVYGGREYSVAGIGARVKQEIRKDDKPIIILADENADAGVFSTLHKELKIAGVNRVTFATSNRN